MKKQMIAIAVLIAAVSLTGCTVNINDETMSAAKDIAASVLDDTDIKVNGQSVDVSLDSDGNVSVNMEQKAAAKLGADIIVSGAGLATELPAYVKGFATKIAPIVSGERATQVLLKLWDKKYQTTADMVVIEGPLAGGHLGFKAEELADIEAMNYEEEVKSIINRVRETEEGSKIPVIAAGGIYEGKDALPYLEMGADGVQVATRFVTTYECDADIRYKEAYIQAKKEENIIRSLEEDLKNREKQTRQEKDFYLPEEYMNYSLKWRYLPGNTCLIMGIFLAVVIPLISYQKDQEIHKKTKIRKEQLRTGMDIQLPL